MAEQKIWWDSPLLFPNNRKTAPNQPDYRGEGFVSDELLTHLVNTRKRGEMPKIEVVGWIKDGHRISLKLGAPRESRDQQREPQAQPAPQPQPPQRQMPPPQPPAPPAPPPTRPPPGPTNSYPPRQDARQPTKPAWDVEKGDDPPW